jgi:hypothetical protein
MILDGQLDDVPEGDFYMKGGIDEVIAAGPVCGHFLRFNGQKQRILAKNDAIRRSEG